MHRGKLTGSRRFGNRRSTRRFALRVGCAGLFALFLSSSAFATGLIRFENRRENAGVWRLVPEVHSLSTNQNYDSTGAKVPVSGLTTYSKTLLDLTIIYGITPKISMYGRLSLSAVTFETSALTGSGSGLGEQGLGFNYRMWDSAPGRGVRAKSIDAQLAFDIPLYNNISSRSSTPRLPLRGDGSLDITPALFGTFPLNQGTGQRLYALTGLGLMIRGNGYSKAIPYQLILAGLPERSGILYRIGFHGFKSMTSDPAGTTALSPQSETSPGVVDPQDAAGSYIVDALNSSYMQMRATLGYQWGVGDQLFATYIMPMSGTSTAVLGGIAFGAQFRFGAGKRAAKPAPGAQKTATKLSYDIEGRVTQANDRLNLIKVDKGESDGIEKGQVFDIYRTGPNGLAQDLVARGIVTNVGAGEAVVNLRQYKKEVWVQVGFIARRIAPKKPQ